MLSLVVPVYNEAEGIQIFHAELKKVADGLGMPVEFIYVNDGSRDNSFALLKSISQSDNRVKAVSLSRNFGHQIALTAGLDRAKGDAVVMLDADLEHPPQLIPELIKKWKEGYDVVYTIRHYPEDIGFFKRITSKIFYFFFKKVSSTPIEENTADFRLLSRRAADSLKSIREQYRFIRGLVKWIGFNQVSVPYTAQHRRNGQTKYTIPKMFRLAMDGVTSFSITPLYISTLVGFFVSGFSFMYALVVLYFRLFTDKTVQGWSAIMLVCLFLGGLQLICLGIIGEYIGKIYQELKHRPLYLIQETVGFES